MSKVIKTTLYVHMEKLPIDLQENFKEKLVQIKQLLSDYNLTVYYTDLENPPSKPYNNPDETIVSKKIKKSILKT